MEKTSRRLPIIAMVMTTLLWSFHFPILKYMLDVHRLSPVTVTWLRLIPSALVFAIIMPKTFLRILHWKTLLLATPMALSGIFINQLLFNTGLSRTSVTHSAVIVCMIPIFVLIMARVFLKEPLTALKITGILTAFTGIVVVVMGKETRPGSDALTGDLITLASTLCFSTYTILGRNLSRRLGPMETVIAAYVVSAVLIMPMAAMHWQEPLKLEATLPNLFALAYIILMGTVTTYTLHCWALSKMESSKVAVFTPAQPVIAGMLACVFQGEPFTLYLGIGGALVIAGVLFTQKG